MKSSSFIDVYKVQNFLERYKIWPNFHLNLLIKCGRLGKNEWNLNFLFWFIDHNNLLLAYLKKFPSLWKFIRNYFVITFTQKLVTSLLSILRPIKSGLWSGITNGLSTFHFVTTASQTNTICSCNLVMSKMVALK